MNLSKIDKILLIFCFYLINFKNVNGDLKFSKSSLRRRSGLTPQNTSKVSINSPDKNFNTDTIKNSMEEMEVGPMKSQSISRIIDICNQQSNLEGELKAKFFFLKCEPESLRKYISVPKVDHSTKKIIEGSVERLVPITWKLNLEGANSALCYASLTVTPTLEYTITENCKVLPENVVLKKDGKNIVLGKRLYDCSSGNIITAPTIIEILAKTDAYFLARPNRLFKELERAFRISQMVYTYKANSKAPEVKINLHPRYFVVRDANGAEIMNDILFAEKLNAIPYLKVILALKDQNLLNELLVGKEFNEQKILLGKWYRRILRAIWLPFYTSAMFTFQNGPKLHCDLHTRNIMIVLNPKFGSKQWKAHNTIVELAVVSPAAMRIIDIGNTISMDNPELQTLNDPCRKLERRPYEDLSLLDYRILDPLTSPAKAPSFLPEETQIYNEDAKVEEINNIRSLIKHYNMKLNKLKTSIRNIYQWDSCRIKREKNKFKRLHPENNEFPCRFIDQKEALIEACRILKRYTAQQFMGLPSCNLNPRRRSP